MAWKSSIPWIASSAAVTLGLVWLGRGSKKRTPSQPPDLDEARARRQALHDIGGEDIVFELDTEDTPADIEVLENAETVQAAMWSHPPEEPYDALDTEDVATEWLFRATESAPPERVSPEEALEGAHVIEPDLVSDDRIAKPSSSADPVDGRRLTEANPASDDSTRNTEPDLER